MNPLYRGADLTSLDHVVVHIEGPVATANLRGDIDIEVTADLYRVLAAATRSVDRMDVHLQEVTFLGSTGLNMLLHLRENAHANGATIRLLNPTPQVIKLFRITALDSLFDIRSA